MRANLQPHPPSRPETRSHTDVGYAVFAANRIIHFDFAILVAVLVKHNLRPAAFMSAAHSVVDLHQACMHPQIEHIIVYLHPTRTHTVFLDREVVQRGTFLRVL